MKDQGGALGNDSTSLVERPDRKREEDFSEGATNGHKSARILLSCMGIGKKYAHLKKVRRGG